jgi:DNA replication protein DnaC
MTTILPTLPSDVTYTQVASETDDLLARLQRSNAYWRDHKREMRRLAGKTDPVPTPPVDIAHPMPASVACAKCHDGGVIKVPAPTGKYGLDGWRYDLEVCQCRAQSVRERRAARIKAASNLTPEMESMTFASYDRTWDAEAYDAAQAFIARLATPGLMVTPFLVLSGTYGSGKTHLLAAIAHAAMQQGRAPLFAVVPSLLDWFKSAFGKQDHSREQRDAFEVRFAGICDADVLLLDDLGAENSTEWAREKLWQLINHRYTRYLPTVFSTNALPEQLEGRIANRLLDFARSEQVYTVDKSYRTDPRRAKQRRTKKGA